VQTLNVTIEFDDMDPDVSDRPPFVVSGWLITRANGELVSAEASGIDPVVAFAAVLRDIASQKK
jgi:hypothetical protein